MELHGLLPGSSNYTFLVTIRNDTLQGLAVYKPQRGERPLWDFPQGSLCLREYAAYLVSAALGWGFVPPTVLREGPYGVGVVQLYVDVDPEANYFTLRQRYSHDCQRLAAFDALINNTDRKAGHCLLGSDGRIWSIDHGVTFHAQPKLRTVIWDFRGQPIPTDILADLRAFQQRLAQPKDPLVVVLGQLLSAQEMRALRHRLKTLLTRGTFPQPPDDWPSVPWPPV
ncbi:MAG: SCO1664 family protein [Chloroflexi bacterium]|nr:SCO1664 family protein [Chloroflexota bacterium]